MSPFLKPQGWSAAEFELAGTVLDPAKLGCPWTHKELHEAAKQFCTTCTPESRGESTIQQVNGYFNPNARCPGGKANFTGEL